MTKEEMINTIRVEMSKKSHIRSNYYVYQETLIGDVLKYIDTNCCFIDDGEGHKSRDMKALNHMLHSLSYNFVWKQDRPIDEQSDECIEFVYNLIRSSMTPKERLNEKIAQTEKILEWIKAINDTDDHKQLGNAIGFLENFTRDIRDLYSGRAKSELPKE